MLGFRGGFEVDSPLGDGCFVIDFFTPTALGGGLLAGDALLAPVAFFSFTVMCLRSLSSRAAAAASSVFVVAFVYG